MFVQIFKTATQESFVFPVGVLWYNKGITWFCYKIGGHVLAGRIACSQEWGLSWGGWFWANEYPGFNVYAVIIPIELSNAVRSSVGWDFPGCPVVKTLGSQCRGHVFDLACHMASPLPCPKYCFVIFILQYVFILKYTSQLYINFHPLLRLVFSWASFPKLKETSK